VLAETNLEVGLRNSIFTRFEFVRKSAEDLVITGAAPGTDYRIHSLVLGYVRETWGLPGGTVGVGFRGSMSLIDRELEPTYGTRTPKGIAVFVRVRPKRMMMDMEMDHRMHDALSGERGGTTRRR
jgi:hypothetical protein